MKLLKPIQFLKLDKSLLLRERKLLNILLNQLCLKLLSSENNILIDDNSVYQIALNTSYVNLLLKAANLNTRVELETIIKDINSKSIKAIKEGESLTLVHQLTIDGIELKFSVNPAFNYNFCSETIFEIDENIHNTIRKKNALIFYELCSWHISVDNQGLKRKDPLFNGEEVLFNLSLSDLKDYFGSDAYQSIPTGQFSRSVIKPAIDYLNTIGTGFSVQVIPEKDTKVITHYTFNMKINDEKQLNSLLFL